MKGTSWLLPAADPEVSAERRRLVADTIGLGISIAGYGLAFGLAACAVGLTPFEALLMSVTVFAGASQFAVLGALSSGVGLIGVIALTAALNARNLLYSAVLAPWLRREPAGTRAVMAHLVSDTAFALALAHFRRLGRADTWGFWWVTIVGTFLPWTVATLVGVGVAGAVPDPSRFGLDVVFPAAMAGTAVTLIDDRRSVIAATLAIPLAVGLALVWDTTLGVLAGALAGGALAWSPSWARLWREANRRGTTAASNGGRE